MSESEPYILKQDPAHPDRILAEVTRLTAGKSKLTEDKAQEQAEEAAGKPTVFQIGNLTRADRVEIGDMTVSPTMRDGGITLDQKRVRKAYEVVQRGLQGWDNFLDSNGKKVDYETTTIQVGTGHSVGVADHCLAHLAQDHITELSEAILIKNGMAADLEKNLDGASPLPSEILSKAGDAPNAQTIKKSSEVVQT